MTGGCFLTSSFLFLFFLVTCFLCFFSENGMKNFDKIQWLHKRAKELRLRPTPAEAKLCSILDSFKIEYEYQKPCGDFAIADVFIPGAGVYIEADGGYHETPQQREKDRIRDSKIGKNKVKRFTNASIIYDSARFALSLLSFIKRRMCWYRGFSVRNQSHIEKIQKDISLPLEFANNDSIIDEMLSIKRVDLGISKRDKRSKKRRKP